MVEDRKKYATQKSSAKHRGIEFNISFDDWLGWWIGTGKYHLRGIGIGKYVMARYGDAGPYELGNIFCCLYEHNCRDGMVKLNKTRKNKGRTKFNLQKLIDAAVSELNHTQAAKIAGCSRSYIRKIRANKTFIRI